MLNEETLGDTESIQHSTFNIAHSTFEDARGAAVPRADSLRILALRLTRLSESKPLRRSGSDQHHRRRSLARHVHGGRGDVFDVAWGGVSGCGARMRDDVHPAAQARSLDRTHASRVERQL